MCEIKSNIVDNKIKYSLLSILKHNIDLDPENLKSYLLTDILSESSTLTTISDISDIHFQDNLFFKKIKQFIYHIL